MKSKAEKLCVMIFPLLNETQVRAYKTMHKRSKSFRERDCIKANTGRNRVNSNGAYNIEQHSAIVRKGERINAQSTIALMEQIREQQGEGNIFLMADNAR